MADSVNVETPQEAWTKCLEIARSQVSDTEYSTWFDPVKPLSMERDEGGAIKLTVQLPSQYYCDWFQSHYSEMLSKGIANTLGSNARLFYDVVIERDAGTAGGTSIRMPARPADDSDDFITVDPPDASPKPSEEAQEFAPSPFAIPGIRKMTVNSNLNSSYTFERFIEGDCNKLARSAAWAIAQQPGTTNYNPFLIYGGVGLGKTHLIQAIGNYAVTNKKIETVVYISSERFTNDFVQAIQHNRAREFSNFYQSVELLIIDDAQFFGGVEKTQEEFFHVFNALHQSGKQIVLSADRPPRDIQGIEERLLSRFQWGLTADMQPPDLETRIAILQRKAEDDGIEIDQDIIEFIAHNIKSNIRELEGALIRLLAYSTLTKQEIDLALAKTILRDLIKETHTLTIDEIQEVVCEYFSIQMNLIREKTRKREIVQARQIAMYFCKTLTQHSLKTIGLHFGGRDHSTVIHANQSVQNQIDTDPKYAQIIEEIRNKIDLRSR